MPTTHNLDNFHQKQTCNFIASYFNSQDMFQILWVKLQWLVSVREKVGTQSGDNGKCMVRDKKRAHSQKKKSCADHHVLI